MPAAVVNGRAFDPRPVLQRDLAVQIRSLPGGAGEIVGSVEIVGRPEGYWSDTMGDHTTAFVVHVEGIRQRLKGKPPAEAIKAMEVIVAASQALPGVAWAARLDGDQKDKYEAARARLEAARQSPRTLVDLQTLINAYLGFRELIPGSTVKTKLKTGAFGRGKGESAPVAVLIGFEDEVPTEATELAAAITRLFDSTGVGLLAAESDPTQVAVMAPGVDSGLEPVPRAEALWKQHLASVEVSFPKSYQAAADLLARTDVPKMIVAQLEGDVSNDKITFASRLQQAVASRSDLAGQLMNRPSMRNQLKELLAPDYDGRASYRLVYDQWQASLDDAGEWLERGKHQYEVLRGVAPATKITFDSKTYEDLLKVAGTQPTKAVHTGAAEGLFGNLQAERRDEEEAAKNKVRQPVADKMEVESKRATSKKRKLDESAKQSKAKVSKGSRGASPQGGAAALKQPFAIQIELAPEGAVARLKAGGRPPSPFAGTMGAHTTAWVVHLDWVRAAVVGQDVDAAIQAITDDLVPVVESRDQATLKRPVLKTHRASLDEARERLLGTKEAAAESPGAMVLQAYINDLLTFVNYVPGTTLRGKPTPGKGEGTHRKTLRDFEAGTAKSQDELREAIRGLFDSHASGDLWDHHLELVGKAYPKAFAASGLMAT